MYAGELILGIGWAAFWIYWLVTTLTSKRSRRATAAKPSDDDQPGVLVRLIILINHHNRLNGITHQPAGDPTPGRWGQGYGTPTIPMSCPTQSACTAGRVRSKS
jgi:hypothetical protein